MRTNTWTRRRTSFKIIWCFQSVIFIVRIVVIFFIFIFLVIVDSFINIFINIFIIVFNVFNVFIFVFFFFVYNNNVFINVFFFIFLNLIFGFIDTLILIFFLIVVNSNLFIVFLTFVVVFLFNRLLLLFNTILIVFGNYFSINVRINFRNIIFLIFSFVIISGTVNILNLEWCFIFGWNFNLAGSSSLDGVSTFDQVFFNLFFIFTGSLIWNNSFFS